MPAHRIGVARSLFALLSPMAAFMLPAGATEPELSDLVPITLEIDALPTFLDPDSNAAVFKVRFGTAPEPELN